MTASSIFLRPDELCARLGVPAFKDFVDPCPTTHKHDCTSPITHPIYPPRIPSYKVDVRRLYALTQQLWQEQSPLEQILVFPPPPDLPPETDAEVVEARMREWKERCSTIDWEKHVEFLKGVWECCGRDEDVKVPRKGASGGGQVVRKRAGGRGRRRGAVLSDEDVVLMDRAAGGQAYEKTDRDEGAGHTSAVRTSVGASKPAAASETAGQPKAGKDLWMARKSAAMIMDPTRDSIMERRQKEVALRAWHMRLAERRAAQERLMTPKTPSGHSSRSTPANAAATDEDLDEIKYTGRRKRQSKPESKESR
ncbi:hypothetical protein HK097_008600, partial [Rhizophlyctis rosea]